MIFFSDREISFFIPFVYRFGRMGIMIGMIATMLLTTLLFVITSLGLKDNFLRNTLEHFFKGLKMVQSQTFYRISGNIGIPLAVAVMFLVMAIVLFISLKTSQFVYSRKNF